MIVQCTQKGNRNGQNDREEEEIERGRRARDKDSQTRKAETENRKKQNNDMIDETKYVVPAINQLSMQMRF